MSRKTDVSDPADAVIDSDAFGELTAELRRAEANHHNVDTLLPRLIRARRFADAADNASAIHHRLASGPPHAQPVRAVRVKYRVSSPTSFLKQPAP